MQKTTQKDFVLSIYYNINCDSLIEILSFRALCNVDDNMSEIREQIIMEYLTN